MAEIIIAVIVWILLVDAIGSILCDIEARHPPEDTER